MKKNKKERNPTTNELIAAKFKKSENYVKGVLKIGDVNPDYFGRITKGKMALYVAYSRAIAEERKEKQEVPKVSDPKQFETDSEAEPTLDSTQVDGEETTEKEAEPASPAVKDDAHSNTKSQDDQEDEPTLDPTQVIAPVDAITVANNGTIEFGCPCGCNKTYVININTNKDE